MQSSIYFFVFLFAIIFACNGSNNINLNFDGMINCGVPIQCEDSECPEPPSCIQRREDVFTNIYTTMAGVPVDDTQNSITVGPKGPALIEDQVLIEKLAIQNRERIPARTVHARGATAFGTFTVINHQREFTSAALFNETGKVTPVAARISTGILGSGSPEWTREPRGFGIKFYTEEGNWDLVGNNIPVFFIRDGIRFPEMVRAQKPNPVTGVQEIWRVLDFFSYFQESLHMFTWMFDDVGIPKSYRHLNCSGVNTFIFANDKNEGHLVRFSLKTLQGIECLLDEDIYAQKTNFMYSTIDLYNAIKSGDYPKWEMYVQRLPLQPDIESLGFDPLDVTKLWPLDIAPEHLVGVLELNRWPSNQFQENELIALTPGRMVPGILPSDDKLLQARIFAYGDAQRYRLGINHHLLPVNKPKCPFLHEDFNSPFEDGFMNVLNYTSQINYFPSRFNTMSENPKVASKPPYTITGVKTRTEPPQVGNDYDQPRALYLSWDQPRRDRFAARFAAALTSKRMDEPAGIAIRNIWLSRLGQISSTLRQKVESLIESVTDSKKRDEKFENLRQAFYLAAGH